MCFSLGKAGNVCMMYAHTKQPQGTAADCWAFSYRRQFKHHLLLLWPSAPGIVCCFSFLVRTYTIKNVEPVLSLVPLYKGSRIARFVETSNAESPTPCMKNPYRHKVSDEMPWTNEGVLYTFLERSRCFVFDKPFEFAKFIERQNQSVKVRFYNICVLTHFPPIGLSARIRCCKDSNFSVILCIYKQKFFFICIIVCYV